MTMTSASRSRSLLVAAATLATWTQGCTTYRSARHSSLAPNAHVRVRDSVPFHVLPQSQIDGSLGAACRMTLVEGSVSHSRGDTAFLLPIRRMVPASEGDRACAFPQGTMLAFPGGQLPAPAVSVQRFSASRTLLALFAVPLAGVVAYFTYAGIVCGSTPRHGGC